MLAVAQPLGAERSLVFEGNHDGAAYLVYPLECNAYPRPPLSHCVLFSRTRPLGSRSSRRIQMPLFIAFQNGKHDGGMLVIPDGNATELDNQLLHVFELVLPKSSSLDLSEWHLSTIDDNSCF